LIYVYLGTYYIGLYLLGTAVKIKTLLLTSRNTYRLLTKVFYLM